MHAFIHSFVFISLFCHISRLDVKVKKKSLLLTCCVDVWRCSDLNGNNRLVLNVKMAHPYGLTVFENYVYWTDWNFKSIHRADKFTGNNSMTLKTGLLIPPFDIKVYSPLRQPPGKFFCHYYTTLYSFHLPLLCTNANSACHPYRGRLMSIVASGLWWRPSAADWGGSMSVVLRRWSMSAIAGSGWLHTAPRYH